MNPRIKEWAIAIVMLVIGVSLIVWGYTWWINTFYNGDSTCAVVRCVKVLE